VFEAQAFAYLFRDGDLPLRRHSCSYLRHLPYLAISSYHAGRSER
jgi:hypothetical protein